MNIHSPQEISGAPASAIIGPNSRAGTSLNLSEVGRRIITTAAASVLFTGGVDLDNDGNCALLLLMRGYPSWIVGVVLNDAIAEAKPKNNGGPSGE